MRILFIRHGQSTGNVQNLSQTPDTPLSEIGREQITKVAKRLSQFRVTKIFSSNYTRASQSAEIISHELNIPVILTEQLHELKEPSEFYKKSVNDPFVLDTKQLLHENQDDSNWHYSDEENTSDVTRRAQEVLLEFTKLKDEVIIVVSHAEFILTMLAVLMFEHDLTPEIFAKFRHFTGLNNASLTEVTYLSKKWKLVTLNDTCHLL